MKKIQLLVIISLIFFTVSCQKDKGVQFDNLGSEFLISSSGYTSLDSQAVLSIKNISKNLTKVNVINMGGTLANDSAFTSSYTGSIAIASDGTGSTTLSDSDLGMDGIGASAKFKFDATYNGKPFSRYYTLNEEDPISVTAPAKVIHRDTSYYFHFKIEPATATVSTVVVQTKVSEQGTYVDVSGSFHPKDSIPINGIDYKVGDTLFVKIIGTAGTKTAYTETPVVIEPNSYTNMASFTLDSTANRAFDFVGDSAVPASSTKADIMLAVNSYTGGYSMGFSSPNSTLFVKGTGSDYANADTTAIPATDFSSAVTFNKDVSVGDVFIFKTMRGTTAHYGVMKITSVEKPQGIVADSYIAIEYKY